MPRILFLAFHIFVVQMLYAQTLPSVELPKYLGLWYELERVPNSFQNDHPNGASACFNTTAEYAIEKDKISVTNTCARVAKNGENISDVARAKAYVVEGSAGAKLKVNFTGWAILRWLGIGDGDYWILALGPANAPGGLYRWALVGGPTTKFGWVLARQPVLTASEWQEIRALQEARGYSATAFQPSRRALSEKSESSTQAAGTIKLRSL